MLFQNQAWGYSSFKNWIKQLFNNLVPWNKRSLHLIKSHEVDHTFIKSQGGDRKSALPWYLEKSQDGGKKKIFLKNGQKEKKKKVKVPALWFLNSY